MRKKFKWIIFLLTLGLIFFITGLFTSFLWIDPYYRDTVNTNCTITNCTIEKLCTPWKITDLCYEGIVSFYLTENPNITSHYDDKSSTTTSLERLCKEYPINSTTLCYQEDNKLLLNKKHDASFAVLVTTFIFITTLFLFVGAAMCYAFKSNYETIL